MPANYSSKRIQDTARFNRWDTLPDSHFAELGTDRDAVKTLQSSMAGHIVMQGDPEYDEARHIFNPVFDRYPGIIAYCQTEADIAFCLAFGALLPDGFTLRSGGHSTAGYSTCDGLLIDISALDHVLVDPVAMTATVGPGCNFGKLYQVLEGYGLHVPAGECPDVCVGGYVQGGGYGFTSVSFGLNCDNVVAFRVMLADGSIVVANALINADLFWALCGGTGGNFGVVLDVTYGLRKLGQVMGWALAWPLTSASSIAEAAAAMMVLQASYMRKSICGPEMNTQVSLCFQNWIDPNQKPPPNTPLSPYFMVRGMWLGDPSKLPGLLQPLTSLPGCITQWILPGTFRAMNDQLLNYPQGMPPLDELPFEDKSSRYIDRDLTLADWTGLFTLFAGAPNNMAYGYGEFYGGAINQIDPFATAFVHRDVALNMVMDVFWLRNAERKACETFLFNWNAALEPLSNGMAYQNYPSPGDTNYATRYWGAAYPILRLIKAKYDPGNAFAFPQQVYALPNVGQLPALPGLPPAVTVALTRPAARIGAP